MIEMGKESEKKKYFVVRERAVPEVLLKVVEAKKLLDSGRVQTVQDAAEQTGISRSSFYKYKDDMVIIRMAWNGEGINSPLFSNYLENRTLENSVQNLNFININ